jgi:hypothetical protein
MKWSAKLESVRKDIEGVFGILKNRFRFLKKYNMLHKQSQVDAAFATCCMLHNMLLQEDGYLDTNLASYPGGLEDRLARTFGRYEGGEGLWNRGNDDTVDAQMEIDNVRIAYTASKKDLSTQWGNIVEALVEHHQYAGVANTIVGG